MNVWFQLNLLCEAYQTYCAGVAKALVLLEDLKTDDDFLKFVTSPAPVSNKDLDIEDFIRKPALVSILDTELACIAILEAA